MSTEAKPMERFARIFETPTTQVLCYLEYDGDADEQVMHRIGIANGMRWDAALRWNGEDEALARKALEGFGDADAVKLAESMAEMCQESDGGEG
jgi:hypothetical protein